MVKDMAASDQDLVRSATQGETADREAAFAGLVRRHMEKAIQLAYLTIGNYEDAKDVSQEAFVKAYRSLDRFEMKAQFSTWLHRILMNTAKDHLRKRKWMNFLSWKTQEGSDNFFETLEASGARPGKNLLDEELGKKMSEAIQSLPFKQRWIFTLRFLEGQSLLEIAKTTRLSEGTVKATLHFAIQKFKKAVFPYLKEANHGL